MTPEEQAIQDQSQAAKYNLANLSNLQSGRIGSLLSNTIDTSGAPPPGTFNFSGQPLTDFSQFGPVASPEYGFAASGAPEGGFSASGDQQYYFGDAGPITRTYGPADNFSADRARVEESLYGRLNPQLWLERGRIEQQLADQGIRYWLRPPIRTRWMPTRARPTTRGWR